MQIYKEAGNKIAKWLKKRKLNQNSLVKPLDINKSNVSRMVKGEKPISLEEAQVLTKVLNIEIIVSKRGLKFVDSKSKKEDEDPDAKA